MFDLSSFQGRYFLTSSIAGQRIRQAYYSQIASGINVAHTTSIGGLYNIPAIAALSMLESGEQAFCFSPSVFKMMTEIPVEDCGAICWPYDAFWLDFPHKDTPEDAGLVSLGLMVVNAQHLPPFLGALEGSIEKNIPIYAARVVVGVYRDLTGTLLRTAALSATATNRTYSQSTVFGITRHLFVNIEHFVFVISFLSKDPTSEEMNYLHDLENTHDMFVHLIALQNRIAVQVALWLDSDQQRDQQRETTLARKKIERVCSRTEPTQEAQINHFSPTITRLGVSLEQCLNNFLSSKEARQLDAHVQEREGNNTTPDRESPQAHLVRAHWRRYWTGKGRTVQERRLILPFPRGVGEYKPRIYTKN